MNYRAELEELVQKYNGTILSADIDKNKIPRIYLQKMVAEGKLEKVNRGVYVSTDAIEDEMYAIQSRYSKFIFSHETALFIHNLTDRTPFEYSVTVPSGYKVVSKIAQRIKAYYIKKEWHGLGVEKAKTSFGNTIKVYSVERTICDIIRSRNRIDIQILIPALKKVVRLKSVDYSLLMNYAKKLKIEKILNHYLEVLL